ncbi:MAG: aminotransferase class V-fold PLP-dependent enzyme [Actinobacteria bacterium]|nr:aminotransferase class V-fold PLP-dependent enzyme [Actinomycetota bacterium]
MSARIPVEAKTDGSPSGVALAAAGYLSFNLGRGMGLFCRSSRGGSLGIGSLGIMSDAENTATETTPGYDTAYTSFVERHPSYAETAVLDQHRTVDFARLDRLGHVYLDYTGGSLYPESLLRRHFDFLSGNVLGNPHSQNPTSAASTRQVEKAREAVLRFFGASRDEYEVIFTANASSALKLVGEAYPFEPGDHLLLSYDNHNSVNGIREFARRRGAMVTYVPVRKPELRLDERLLAGALAHSASPGNRLFAYPAQSNFSGVQHSLEWVDAAHEQGWDVLLDCAAYVPSNRLDLHTVKPDFVALSFYKMIGYPTGIGALLARREALAKLRRPWFSGGTITLASVQGEGWHHLAPAPAGFEDGTVNYLGLPAVTMGLEHLESIGIEMIHRRVMILTGWLLEEMGGAQAQQWSSHGSSLRAAGHRAAWCDACILPSRS